VTLGPTPATKERDVSEVPIPTGTRTRLADAYQRLRQSRKVAPLLAVVERFREVDGATQGGLLAIQLFTVVIPLMIIGFAYFMGVAEQASVGNLFTRQLGLHPPLDSRVREAFGTAASIRSSLTFLGVAGFLVWGIPMSIKVAAVFARAWRREQFGVARKLARGAAWFAIYLTTMFLRQRIGFAGEHGVWVRTGLLMLSLAPVWAFWSLTPWLLVRDGGRGWRSLLLAGTAGLVIDGIVLASAARVVLPRLLEGWASFGPIGVAMTLMTWCGILGVGWVIIACAGAIVWERSAAAPTVIGAQTAAGVLCNCPIRCEPGSETRETKE